MPKRKRILGYKKPSLIPGALQESGVVHSKTYMYQQASQYGLEAINMLVYLMRECNNPFVKLSAAKTILNKTIPDLKAVEVTGELNQRAMIVVKQYGEGDIIANTVKEVEANKENRAIEQPKVLTKEEQQLHDAINKVEL